MTQLDRRRGGRPLGFVAIIGTLVLALAVAACGSSSSSTTSSSSAASSGSSGGSSTAASSGSSTAAATAALAPYKATPTAISVTTPLNSAPPSGKTIVMLGTNNPSNVIIQQGLQKLAQMAHWNYSLVSYDPANPGTFTQAETTALAKHPQAVVRKIAAEGGKL